jgi:polysaccharide deacetylase 2 family uncharacterized protein YibQ
MWFWAALLLLVGGAVVALQVAGPVSPVPRSASQGAMPPGATPPGATPTGADRAAAGAGLPRLRPAQAEPGRPQIPAAARPAIAPPDQALLEPSAEFPGTSLPRIGADRRSPMQAYAAASDPAETRPRIAILVSGIGLSQTDSRAAIEHLPAAVSLAVSPYAGPIAGLLESARAHGHELLASLPMEPRAFPIDDPGDHALLTGNAEGENLRRLDWALTRFAGYVGATDALGPGLRGERYAASPELMRPVLAELAARGLLYVEARPGAPRPPSVVGRSIDLVLDEPANAATITTRLADLERIARQRGSALGLADLPEPVLAREVAAWASALPGKGLALMPVSAVVPLVPPAPASAEAQAP